MKYVGKKDQKIFKIRFKKTVAKNSVKIKYSRYFPTKFDQTTGSKFNKEMHNKQKCESELVIKYEERTKKMVQKLI